MNNDKIKFIIGCISLIISGILISFFEVKYEKDYIMLAGIIIFGMIFLKCFRSNEIEEKIYKRVKKYVNVLAIVLIFIALLLLPNSIGTELDKKIQVIAYFVSYLCWFAGLYLLSIKSELQYRN